MEPVPIGWQEGAACRSVGPALFFPSTNPSRIDEEAVAVLCRVCPVRIACLEAALDYGRECVGIWSGLGSAKRRHLRQARSRQIRERFPEHRFTPGCSCSFCRLATAYLGGDMIDRNTSDARCGYRSSYGRNCRCVACVYVVAFHTRMSNVLT